MSASENLEIEVKFLVLDREGLRQRLIKAGAQQAKPRLHERNVRYDDAQQSLLHRGELLRLRQDDGARLTFKGMAEEAAQSEAKVRSELEVTVDDFETTAAILQRLGYEAQQVYEKYRETFTLDNVEVVLDELPFGDFVELEGAEAQIRAVAQKLGLPWEQRILDNYLLLMARTKAYYDLPFEDLTFENFAGRDLSIATILRGD